MRSRAEPSLDGELVLGEELSLSVSSGGVVGWGWRLGCVVCPAAVGTLALFFRLRFGVSHGSSWRVPSTRLSQWAAQVLSYTRLIGVAFGAPAVKTSR